MREYLSDPARSIKFSLPLNKLLSGRIYVISIAKIVWDQEDLSLTSFESTYLFFCPIESSLKISSAELTEYASQVTSILDLISFNYTSSRFGERRS